MDRIKAILEGDRLLQHFGMQVVEARDGYAKVTATVQEGGLNAHRIGHGALIFAVADVAFALAVNAARDAVGVQWSVNMFRAARLGEMLTGEARTIHAGRQSAVCELTVTAGDGRLLARGQATALPRAPEPARG
ncbi:MAG: PaaI family thioesterase [Candidatus Methylomirabilales bacterium]